MEALVIGVGVACVGVIHVSRLLKEQLDWVTDKQLRIINNIMLCKTVMPLRNYVKNKVIVKFQTILYALLCGL